MSSCKTLVVAVAVAVLSASTQALVVRGSDRNGSVVQPLSVGNSTLQLASESKVRTPDIAFSSSDVPQMFVAVMTRRAAPLDKRMVMRQLWTEVDKGHGHICMRFVVCQKPDQYQQTLAAEQKQYGDLLIIGCEEGYAHGLLTRKVIETMRTYRNSAHGKDKCLDRPLFAKMDDDTFVAGPQLRQTLSAAVAQFGSDSLYAGVYDDDRPMARNPVRIPSSPWYQPLMNFSQSKYPATMYGGPGYILGRGIVDRFFDEGIADANVLYTEDRSVGVWINILEQRSVQVSWVRLPGTSGFYWSKPVKSGTWAAYPYALHHHLSQACISCMIQIEKADNQSASIDRCFQLETLLDPCDEQWSNGQLCKPEQESVAQ